MFGIDELNNTAEYPSTLANSRLCQQNRTKRKWILRLATQVTVGQVTNLPKCQVTVVVERENKGFSAEIEKIWGLKCWSINSSFLLQFLKLFVEGMTLRYFVVLSCS